VSQRANFGEALIRPSWRVAYWLLFAMFIVTAALNMLHVRAGFLTNYAADLFLPPWLYIVLRGLAGYRGLRKRLFDWLGGSPALTAGSLFVGSAATEVSQVFWPRGVFAGTFDPLDLAAYAAGLLVCYLIDTRQIRRALPIPSVPGDRT
jgi:hypothetical protein